MLWFVALLAGCPTSPSDPDDSDTAVDTDTDDPDTDLPEPLDGFGALSGDCGLLDAADFTDPGPQILQSAIDLPDGFDDDLLSAGGQVMVDEGNLNASSLYSEVFAYEVLYRCDRAELLLTEGEVTYTDPSGKKTDLVVEIDDTRVGVSVVRAVGFPRDDPYTVEDAAAILEDKLSDILLSSANVAPAEAWEKQILHVIAYGPEHATSIGAAWEDLDDAVRADTIVVVTTTNGTDGFIYGD
jgi:hypothetical protein